MEKKICDPARLAVLEKARAKAKENRDRRKVEKEQAQKQLKETEKIEIPIIKVEDKKEEKEFVKDIPLCEPKAIPRPPTPPPNEEQVVVVKKSKKPKQKVINPRNMSKPPQTEMIASLAKPSDKQPVPDPPVLQRGTPYTFQVSSIMNKYFPN